ncbi:pentapeptide repeat-containing protein [Listeria monocytogenes]|nr:pentapeptide repeat-containing protein [Listeria monocytogenes]
MGRSRKKQRDRRKMKSKLRRNRRRKSGKPVYFSLSNYSKKLHGAYNRYYPKPNLHNVSFRNSDFKNCRFKSGHITSTSMREVNFIGCDFIKVNFRETNFKNATFTNCYFFQCDLKDSNFDNATFINTYFVSSSIKYAKNFSVNESFILRKYPNISLSNQLVESIQLLINFPSIKKFGVLTTDNEKINKWVLSILLNEFPEKKIIRFFKKISKNSSSKQKKFITLNSFREDLIKYAPNMV